MMALMQTALGALPAQSRVESLTLTKTGGVIAGYTPITQSATAPDPAQFQRTPSQRPGFDRFSFEPANETAP